MNPPMKPQRLDLRHFVPAPGITLIEASAGTGKTHNITHIICDLVASGTCRLDQVLVLTFTEKATQELRDRTRRALQEQLRVHIQCGNDREIRCLSEAIDQFDCAAIFTIHGFCNRILREFSVEAGLGSEFAILQDERSFEDQLQIEVARSVQASAAHNPWIALGMNALELKSNFFRNALRLKESDDLKSTPRNSPRSNLLQWFTHEFQLLQSAWKQDRNAIRAELLSDTPPLKKSRNCYKPEHMQLAFDSFDRVFSGKPPHLTFLADLLPFQYSRMVEQLRKGQSVQPLSFYLTLEALPEQLDSLAQFLIVHAIEVRNQQVERLVQEQQTLRFDELLRYAKEIVCMPDGHFAKHLYEAYPYALVDEFQDTDPVQFAILDRIFLQPPAGHAPRPLILIGDPKQAIYSFRGGDIFTYGLAKSKAQQFFYLDTNWRSSPAINEGVNELLQGPNPFHFEWIDYQPVNTAPRNHDSCLLSLRSDADTLRSSGIEWRVIDPSDGPQASLHQAAADICELLKHPHFLHTASGLRRLSPGDIAVLVPDNKSGGRMHEALGQHRIPSTLFGGASVFQTPEALHLIAILEAVHQPRDFQQIRAALSASCFDPNLLIQVSEDKQWMEVLRAFAHANQLWQLQGLEATFAYLDQRFEWRLQLSRSAAADRALANHQQLRHLLIAEACNTNLGPHRLLQWLQEQIREPNRNDPEQLLQLSSDKDAITILTMHKSKGLEFPVVFLPLLPQKAKRRSEFPRQFHDPSSGNLRTSLTPFSTSESDASAFATEVFGEALRTLYVAITRAGVLCTLYLDPNTIDRSALDFWLPAGEDLSARLSALHHRAMHTEASKIEQSQLHSHIRSQQASLPVDLLPPDSPPATPAPLAHLSFTGIAHGVLNRDIPDSDEPVLLENRSEVPQPPNPLSLSIASFDRGTQAGLMFHDLLEHLPFQDASAWPEHVKSSLQRYGYETDRWTPVLLPWLHDLVNSPVQMPDGICLCLADLQESDCFRETEFSVFTTWGNEAWNALRELVVRSSWLQQFSFELPDTPIHWDERRAFLNGVVDCWCRYQGKYYLLDWKSNYLGSEPSAYTANALAASMQEHYYHLQYLLYICALNRYLRWVDPSYLYERDFGGVAYGYLRGIQREVPNAGWFTAQPPAELVSAMETLLPFPELQLKGENA